MTRVVIVDDQEMVRTGLGMVLESEPDLEVVGGAGDGEQAVRVVARERPDVVLMDVRMPGTDGIEATRRITEAHPEVAVIMLTTFDVDEYVYGALRAGASGFLLKDAPADDLVAAIRVVASGEALLAPSITKRLIAEFAARRETTAPQGLDSLTEREAEVLRLVARGMTNAEIAAELYLGETTVKTHVSRLLTKLGLRDRVQLVVAAYESGLIHPGS
ncbi:MAG: response regulator transcription factor [Actinomycetota bacterium]|nr:response regulator transcription factor [Actinomycetota bacterium]MDH4016238.1 response regulator transcription factor [Actinomycetota bacterium]